LTKSYQEIMQILEWFDLTRSYRSAAQLAGCDAKTVPHYVDRRDTGMDPSSHLRRPPFLIKLLVPLRDQPADSTSPDEDGTPLNVQSLEDPTEDELREVVDYADFVKERGRRRRPAPQHDPGQL
jgi:hypothetical protein